MRTPKNLPPRAVHSLPEPLLIRGEHELEYVRRGLRELFDLTSSGRVQDGETGVDVPFVGEDAEHDVYFDGLDSADVEPVLPRVGLCARPGCAHAEVQGFKRGS